MTSETHTPLSLADLIDKELMGIEPDSQCVVLDDADWLLITKALRRAVPDVPELDRYDLDFHGLHGEDAYMRKDDNGEFVLHSQAAEIITAKDKEINKLNVYNGSYHNQILELRELIQAVEAKLAQYEAQATAPCPDLKAEIIETCRKAVRNAVLKMSPEHRANADLCDDVIYRAIATVKAEASHDKG